MQVLISDVFDYSPHAIGGNPLEVENGIRALFGDTFSYVPFGDLEGLTDAVNRLYGYSITISDSTGYTPPKRQIIRRPLKLDDPWVREGQMQA